MADLRSDFALGEDVLKDAETEAVELSTVVVPGQPLKITGVTSEGIPKVGAITAVTDLVRYLAVYAGIIGDFQKVMVRGRTKVTFGGTIVAGANLEFTVDGDVITAADVNPIKGFAVDAGADDDLGFIQFDGGSV